MNSTQLKQKLKAQRSQHNYSENFCLRIHRAISWLNMAENTKDLDTQYIALWIAFNAIYANKIDVEGIYDHSKLNEFLFKIYSNDEDNQIYDLIWKKFSSSIRLLLKNRYVFTPFWEFHNKKLTEEEYLAKLNQEQHTFKNALERQNTSGLLVIIFNRLYTLRNQIIHGGSTHQSQINRPQLKDGCAILNTLIPVMVDIMLDHHQNDWGEPYYPVVSE